MRPALRVVEANVRRMLRATFGSGSTARIREFPKAYVVELLTDAARHPQDRGAFLHTLATFDRFFKDGFGARTDVQVKARLMAGERLDGGPADQLLILPPLLMPQPGDAHGQRAL